MNKVRLKQDSFGIYAEYRVGLIWRPFGTNCGPFGWDIDYFSGDNHLLDFVKKNMVEK